MKPFSTVLIGFGNVGMAYAQDPLTARHYAYITHAQVLRDHPAFEWAAVVDPAAEARRQAQEVWGVPYVAASVEALPPTVQAEVAILATPAEARLGLIDAMPHLRAVLVEKPLGPSLRAARAFLEALAARDVAVQVNYWRRADEGFRALAGGGLAARIGAVQAVTGFFGGGLRNNGSHVVDFVRMLVGEVVKVQAWPNVQGDTPEAAALALHLESGEVCTLHLLDFEAYREVALDLWGQQGRLQIMNEGLVIQASHRAPHRALQGAFEIDQDHPTTLPTTVGRALCRMYDNLADFLARDTPLWSPGPSALQTERVLAALEASLAQHGHPAEVQ